MNNYQTHAQKEFEVLGWTGKDKMQKEVCEHLMELLGTFGGHGHSRSSAPYVVNLFKKLALFEPISPLTGKDSEWNEVEEGMWQNKRCSHVFKEKDGKAYDINGKVFKRKDGGSYTNSESRVFIEFPYTPKTEYLEVVENVK